MFNPCWCMYKNGVENRNSMRSKVRHRNQENQETSESCLGNLLLDVLDVWSRHLRDAQHQKRRDHVSQAVGSGTQR